MLQRVFRGFAAPALALLLIAPARSQPSATTNSAPAPDGDAKSYVDYGIDTGRKGDLDGALGAFNHAIQIDPKYAPAYNNRGYVYLLEGRQNDAIADLSQAIQLDPKLEDAYYRRGSVYGQQGDFKAAAIDFSSLIKLNPNNGAAHWCLGHVLYFDGQMDAALAELNESIRLEPNIPFTYFIRGLINFDEDHRTEALSDFQKSLGLNYPAAAYWIWIVDTEQGEHGSARQDLSDALLRSEVFKPDDWSTQIGNYLLESVTEADLLAKAKAGNPPEIAGQECQAWFYIGMYKHFNGDKPGAHDAFTSAVKTAAKGSEEFVEAQRQLAAEGKGP